MFFLCGLLALFICVPISEIEAAKQYSFDNQTIFYCCASNCPRGNRPFFSVNKMFRHIINKCKRCPWCRQEEMFANFEFLVNHIILDHKIDVKLMRMVSLDEKISWKKRYFSKRAAGSLPLRVYICWPCKRLEIEKNRATRHKCRLKRCS